MDWYPLERVLLFKQQREQAPAVALGQFWGETSGVGILQTSYYQLLEQVLLWGRDQTAGFILAPDAEHRQILSPGDTWSSRTLIRGDEAKVSLAFSAVLLICLAMAILKCPFIPFTCYSGSHTFCMNTV